MQQPPGLGLLVGRAPRNALEPIDGGIGHCSQPGVTDQSQPMDRDGRPHLGIEEDDPSLGVLGPHGRVGTHHVVDEHRVNAAG